MIHQPIGIEVIIAGTIGGSAILNAAIFWLMPRLTRPDLYFAVTVPPGFRDGREAKSILRRYRTELVLFSVLAMGVFLAGVTWFSVGFVSVGHIIQIVAGFIAFYRARRQTLPHAVPPTMIREAELHKHDRVIPGGWIAGGGPFILLAACAAYLWTRGVETPARLPGLWQGYGQPIEFRGHSLPIYLLTVFAILTSLSLVLYGLARWVRPVHAGGREAARELKFRRTVSAIILVTEYYVTLEASWIMSITHHYGLIPVVTFPLTLVFVLVVLVVLGRLGQGGSRLLAADQESSAASVVPIGDRTPDCYWKLGVFYFNREDSAVIVEKRFGLGYSLNFACPIAWVILLLILMAPLIPILAHLTRFLPRAGA